MRATLYIRKQDIEDYLTNKGYTLKTLRKIILDEFGFKNSKEFHSEYANLSPAAMNIKLAYLNQEEYESILVLVSDMLKFLKSELKDSNSGNQPPWPCYTMYGRDIVFYKASTREDITLQYNREDNKDTLYIYTVSSVFRKEFVNELKEKTEINEIYLSI